MIIFLWFIEFLCWSSNALSVLVPFGFDSVNKKATQKTPIILIHGWMTGNILYLWFKIYLEKKGFEVHIPNFGLQMGNLHKYPHVLNIYIKDKNIKNPVIVGISTGGLVAIEYANEIDKWKNTKKLITIAAPFKGTHVAFLSFFSKSAKQIRPKSDYIKHID